MGFQALQTCQTTPGMDLTGLYRSDDLAKAAKKQAAVEEICSTFGVSEPDLKAGLHKLERGNARPPDADDIKSAIYDIAMAFSNAGIVIAPPQQVPMVADAKGACHEAGCNAAAISQRVGQRSGTGSPGMSAPGSPSAFGPVSADPSASYDPASNDIVSGNADPESQAMETLRYQLQVLGIPPEQIDKVLSLLVQSQQQANASENNSGTDTGSDDGQYATDEGQYPYYGSPVSYDPPRAQMPWQAQWQAPGQPDADAMNTDEGAFSAGFQSQDWTDRSQSFLNTQNLGQLNSASQLASPQSSADTYVFRDPTLDAEIARREATDPAGAQALRELANQPVAKWVNGDPNDGQIIKQYMDDAEAAGKKGLVTMYDIPGRDLNNYSAGGASSNGEYLANVDAVAQSIGNRKAEVILEPDALMDSTRIGPDAGSARRQLMSQAVDRLTAQPNTTVSIAAGSPGYASPSQVADLLIEAGIGKARNFSVGESGFIAPDKLMAYGDSIVSELAKRGVTGVHYSVETARSGVETHGEGSAAWAEADGAASGIRPTSDQAIIKNPNVSSFNWVKLPWQADGRIAAAGSLIPDYAISLIKNAHANGVW